MSICKMCQGKTPNPCLCDECQEQDNTERERGEAFCGCIILTVAMGCHIVWGVVLVYRLITS